MAMIRCTDCGREMSDKAVACPNCGHAASRPEFEPPPPPTREKPGRKPRPVKYTVAPRKQSYLAWTLIALVLAFLVAVAFVPGFGAGLRDRFFALFGFEPEAPAATEPPAQE